MQKTITLTNGIATAHRFPTIKDAARALASRPHVTQQGTDESRGRPDKYCSVVPKFEEYTDDAGEIRLRPVGVGLEVRK